MENLLIGTKALSFFQTAGFSVLRNYLARDETETVALAKETGFPVTLKISSPNLLHKTDVGGVRVDLRNEDEVRSAYRELVNIFRSLYPEGKMDGIMVQEMAKGHEIVVGTLYDRQFGHVLMFGLGGVLVEVLRDVSFRIIPIRERDAREMIREIKGYEILKGFRGKGADIKIIEELLLKVSQLLIDHPEILEMDLNPVFAYENGYAICDARIKCS